MYECEYITNHDNLSVPILVRTIGKNTFSINCFDVEGKRSPLNRAPEDTSQIIDELVN